jgi:hypothetical protein
MHAHGWNLDAIENLAPWERDVYVALLIEHIEQDNRRNEQ